ncbi:MAG: sugar phosphate isomerase/epimerase [Puniceicoccales bacterium]|jgi:sugar phosphate isomerase/epimerase|nr:sugar phosphate isomerase/epimerase [Puniceicoccales bacterium]
MSHLTRRHFISAAATATAAAVTAAAVPQDAHAAAAKTSKHRRFKLGVASYSYWHFTPKKFPLEAVIDKAAALGVEGVDILHRQMESEENDYIQRVKRHAFLNGVDLICLSMHQNFVSTDAEQRKKQIAHTLHCIEIAAKFGIPSMRINAGRWGTIRSFDALMTARGIEPLPPGVTENDGFAQAIDGIRQCVSRAAECGVILALENHWGLSGSPEGMLRIFREVNSPWLQLLPDTGNFLEDPYDKLAKVFPHACYVQAKTYFGGGEWYTLDLDYKRIFRQLRAANFRGYVGVEFEGKAPADEGVLKSVELLRAAMG